MQQNIYRVSKKNTHPAKAEYFHYRVTYFSENFTGYNGVILTFSPNFSSKYSPAEKLRALEDESRKIEINKNYSIMYRRLQCMKIFLSIYFSGPFFAAQTLHDQEVGPKEMLEIEKLKEKSSRIARVDTLYCNRC